MLPSLLYDNGKPKYPRAMGNSAELRADLGLDALLDAMSGGGGPHAREAAKGVIFEHPAITGENILFRQEILKDALNNADIFTELSDMLESGLAAYEDARKKSQPGYARFIPVSELLRSAAELMNIVFTLAGKARKCLESKKLNAASAGLSNYARAYGAFYSEDFVSAALRESGDIGHMSEKSCLTLGAKLGNGFKGTSYVVREIGHAQKAGRTARNGQTAIPLDSVAMQLKAMELRDAALSRILSIINAVISQTAEDLKSLSYEMNFYAGCIRLYREMARIGVPVCFPVISAGADTLDFEGLTDIALALAHGTPPVANSLNMDGARLTVVTGANQGGKSTFLRSVGGAQLMAQRGMFVAAERFRFSVRPRIFTHFCRREDASMESGKLDEELARLEKIVDKLEPGAMLLMNESFSSTAEREGAAIAREVTGAFYDLGVKVVFVTHLYEYARSLESAGMPGALLLRAGRLDDGRRTFTVAPGISAPTSYGMDLFEEIFASDGIA